MTLKPLSSLEITEKKKNENKNTKNTKPDADGKL